jgi:hypothetical protein
MSKNPSFQHISCDVSINSEDEFVGTDVINFPKHTNFTLTIDYPLTKPYVSTLNTEYGLTVQQVIDFIRDEYYNIYENPKKYGVWGHSLSDLYLEGITVDFDKKKISILVGS